MLSYHNDEKLKSLVISEMKNCLKQEIFTDDPTVVLSNLVGLCVQSVNKVLRELCKQGLHKDYNCLDFEKSLGIPISLARRQVLLSWSIKQNERNKFLIDFLSAIPVGVNLELFIEKFDSVMLKGKRRYGEQENIIFFTTKNFVKEKYSDKFLELLKLSK